MNKLNLIRFLFLCFILNSCQPKKEKKQPVIFNNGIQNYKYDDDQLVKKKTKNVNDQKHDIEKNKSDKVHQ
jgi:hypothetical protein